MWFDNSLSNLVSLPEWTLFFSHTLSRWILGTDYPLLEERGKEVGNL